MKSIIIEATSGDGRWGKFLVAKFDTEEWTRSRPLLSTRANFILNIGRDPSCVIVFDLFTGEGALFIPGGLASADLDKHKIRVCPLFEPFLAWLYKQDLTDIRKLPTLCHMEEQ